VKAEAEEGDDLRRRREEGDELRRRREEGDVEGRVNVRVSIGENWDCWKTGNQNFIYIIPVCVGQVRRIL